MPGRRASAGKSLDVLSAGLVNIWPENDVGSAQRLEESGRVERVAGPARCRGRDEPYGRERIGALLAFRDVNGVARLRGGEDLGKPVKRGLLTVKSNLPAVRVAASPYERLPGRCRGARLREERRAIRGVVDVLDGLRGPFRLVPLLGLRKEVLLLQTESRENVGRLAPRVTFHESANRVPGVDRERGTLILVGWALPRRALALHAVSL